jgi:hypothetical protein
MKKHLLFLPDIFLVLLILFTCERIDLTDWRNSSSSGSLSQEKSAIAKEHFVTTTAELTIESEVGLTSYKERARRILSVFSIALVEN